MNKVLIIAFCLIGLSSFSVQAAETVSSEKKAVANLLGGEEEKGADTKQVPSKTVEDAKDSRGLFSFMNFSFGKEENVAPTQKKEDTLESLTKEADEGNINSQITLGYLYLYGNDKVQPNYEKSFQYYGLAAEQGDRVAVNNLGILYYSGIGTERNVGKAALQFEKAVQLGNNEAAVNLAFIYLTGTGGVVKNYPRAMELFSIAAQSNNSVAEFMLGYAYYRGFVYDKNLIEAFNLMKKSASAQYDDAQYILGKMYLQGDGTTKNYGQAVKNFSLAAEQGNVNAMMDLGDILVAGTVYNKNLYKAHILFNVASVRGAEKAAQKRDLLETALKIEEFLQAQAEAEAFSEKPSELTAYIRKTYGTDIKSYIDAAIPANNRQIRK
ncbi:MAG: tetratricopeptide repeat protein [Alphaproteobacteria bacterium]